MVAGRNVRRRLVDDHPPAVIGVPDELWGEQVGAILPVRFGHEHPRWWTS